MMWANIFGSEAQGDFLREIVVIDDDGAVRDQSAAAIKIKRHGFPFHAGCAHGEVKLEFTPAKGEFRSSEVGHAHVGEALRVPSTDGKNRHRQRAAAFQALPIPIGYTIAENHNS